MKAGFERLRPAGVSRPRPGVDPVLTNRQAPIWGFLAAFREAAEKWHSGDRSAIFPGGCYPPALPFV